MTKALVKVAAKRRPVSGDILGYRLVAAIPNLAGRKMVMTSSGPRATKEEAPSFRKPYLISESMDHSDLSAISEADCERFAKSLKWAGYTSFEFLDEGKEGEDRARIEENFSILSA
jgi:hypothetical protein